MTYGVREGDRSVCAHCTDCEEFANVQGYTEGNTWQLATQHVRDTGHGVMMHWRQFLDPLGARDPLREPGEEIPDWELEAAAEKQDHDHDV